MRTTRRLVPNGDGWHLSLNQTYDPDRLLPGRRPVLIIPGYGMNSFIYSYHPNGPSLEGYLAEAGLEVWRADLRGQSGSVRAGGSDEFGLADLALTDVRALLGAVLEGTRTGAGRVDVIGGSLGGSLMFAHAALVPGNPMASLVCIGTPVRWEKIHPLMQAFFASPRLAGALRFRGSRQLAETMLPLLARFAPSLLSIYLNAQITDLSAAREMVRTVEDPNRFLNREIAVWVRQRDLIIDGTNVAEALERLTNPLLCVLARGDGIVPPETAAFAFHKIGSQVKKLVEVGSDAVTVAHADLFVSREAQARVFAPICEFLLEQEAERIAGAGAVG
ncbi:MAG: alpha/beta fold hydrolase [Myxococcales bacterium]|jgi:pimeloyl-ACP methyl ester carboxylesterase